MSDRQDIILSATDRASPSFQRVGQSAQRMGQEIDQSARRADQGFRGVGRSAQDLTRNLDQAERQAAETARGMDRLGQAAERAERTTDRLSRAGAALGGVASAVAGLLADAARAAAEEEAVFARLESAVEATGASFDALSGRMDLAIDRAESLSFADDQAATALATLTTITGNASEAMDLLSLTMDVARGRGISLADAATLVGRVAEGNTAILARYGIAVDEGATATEALASLQQRYSGQAVAYSETTQGAIDRLRNAFDNWMESVGASTGELQAFLAILPGLSIAFTSSTALIGGMATALGPLGLVAAGAAAVVGLGVLIARLDDVDSEAIDAERAVASLTDALYVLTDAGASATQIAQVQAWGEAWQAALATYQAQLDAIAAYDNIPTSTGPSINPPNNEQIQQAGQLLGVLAERMDDVGVNADGLNASITYLFEQLRTGAISFEDFLRYLTLYDEQFRAIWGQAVPEAITRQGLLTGAIDLSTGAMQRAMAVGIEYVREFMGGLDELTNVAGSAVASPIFQSETWSVISVGGRDAALAAKNMGDAFTAFADGLSEYDLAIGRIAAGTDTLADSLYFLEERQGALNASMGEHRSNLSDIEAAYEILQQRQANGEQLSQDQLDFLAQYEQLTADVTRNIEDQQVELGLLAAAEEAAGEAQATVNANLSSMIDLLAEIVALLGGDPWAGLAPEKSAIDDWANLNNQMRDHLGLRNAMADAIQRGLGGPAPLPTTPSPTAPTMPTGIAGDGTQGPVGVGDGLQAVAPAPATAVVRIQYDSDDAQLQAIRQQAEDLLAGPDGTGWTITFLGDGEHAVGVVRDTEGEVQAFVTEEHVVRIDADTLDADRNIAGVAEALRATDGDSATVNLYANTAPARNAIYGLTGYQGDAYVNVYANPVGVGYTDLEFASGGIVEAASGRVVRAGEIGPELVYPPGGAPYVAARDGLYVMQPGTYVSNAAASAGRLGGGGLTINFHGPVYGFDDFRRQVAAIATDELVPAFVGAITERRTALGLL